MVLRRIDTGAIISSAPSAALPVHARTVTQPEATSAPAVAARAIAPPLAGTIRPPRRDEDAEVAAPIPLTRLQTPRAPFRSAIDWPSPISATSRDEPSVRETTSGSLPPLVATLPPVAQPIYLPASVTSPGGPLAWLGRMSVDAFSTRGAGALAVVAAVIVLGGVAVGKRIVSTEGAAASRVAPLSPPAVQSLPAVAVQPGRSSRTRNRSSKG
jgi:hypothetical protein